MDGVNNLWLKVIVNVVYYVCYVRKDLVKEWLFGVNIVDMVGMLNSIKNGLRRISIVHMDVSMSVFQGLRMDKCEIICGDVDDWWVYILFYKYLSYIYNYIIIIIIIIIKYNNYLN